MQSGTSLMELLVVIVIFLIGILAIARIFPGGFRVLNTNRAQSFAIALGKAELDRLAGSSLEVPEQIVPVIYNSSGAAIEGDFDLSNLGPQGNAILLYQPSSGPSEWDVYNGATDLGPWALTSGANNVRHVVGEGNKVPAPQSITIGGGAVGSFPAGTISASLVNLNFAPIVTSYPSLMVYSNDLARANGTPIAGQTPIPYQFYFDDSTPSDPVLNIPQDATHAYDYRLSMVAYLSGSSPPTQVTYVALTVHVPANATPGYQTLHLNSTSDVPGGPGAQLQFVDSNSIRVARKFTLTTAAAWDPTNPFEYQVLNAGTLGQILVNPIAYRSVQRTGRGVSVPVEIRADYDVYDWRILKEDFRLPSFGDGSSYRYQLKINSVKGIGGEEPDGTAYQGINVEVYNENSAMPGLERRDILLVDMANGAIISKDSYQGLTDYRRGVLTFTATTSTTSGLPVIHEYLPGQTTASEVSPSGLRVRAYYEAVGEWSAQVIKSAANYIQIQSAGPLPGQFYIAPPVGSVTIGTPAPNNDLTIQFAKADVGSTVSFDELWYERTDPATSGSVVTVARGQSAVVHGADSLHAFPYVLITDIDPRATSADFSNGYAVRGVKGESISVRVLYNQNFVTFKEGGDGTQNIPIFEQWMRGWHNMTTDGVLSRGALGGTLQ